MLEKYHYRSPPRYDVTSPDWTRPRRCEYRQPLSKNPRALHSTPEPLTWASVPEDYDVQLKALRRHLDISQAGLARMVGAAGRPSSINGKRGKRTPSPVFWQRLTTLFTTAASP